MHCWRLGFSAYKACILAQDTFLAFQNSMIFFGMHSHLNDVISLIHLSSITTKNTMVCIWKIDGLHMVVLRGYSGLYSGVTPVSAQGTICSFRGQCSNRLDTCKANNLALVLSLQPSKFIFVFKRWGTPGCA